MAKIEPIKYRPYANAQEFLEAQKIHGPYINISSVYRLPVRVSDKGIEFDFSGIRRYSFSELLSGCVTVVWQDGRKCGIIYR